MLTEAKKLKLIKRSVTVFGAQAQYDQFHEEVGELMTAINHYKRGRNTIEDVMVEIVDVRQMIRAIIEVMGIDLEELANIETAQWKKLEDQMNQTENESEAAYTAEFKEPKNV